MVILKGCRYGDEERVRRLRLAHRPQQTLAHGIGHNPVQIRFNDVYCAAVNGVHRILICVYAYHPFAARGKRRGGGQTDIPQSNNGNCVKIHGFTCYLFLIP